MLDKARTLPADAVILDLEDGVPAGGKVAARRIVRAALEAGPFQPYAILRVNAFHTGLVEEDLRQAFGPGIGAVCLPKAETAGEVARLASLLADVEQGCGLASGAIAILLMVETALGVIQAYEMARASRRVRALCLGGEDLTRDLGAVRSKAGQEVALARAQVLLAARAAGAVAVDTIFSDLNDTEGLLAEARQAQRLGYSGKLIIHPAQIEPVHRAFTPSDEEVAYARRVLEAFAAAEARGDGVIALEGQMIDAPVVARAREIVARAGGG
jgi:citrate lyase subunit beta/citryl-CoA lyase